MWGLQITMSCDDHTAQNDSASVEAIFGSAIKDNAVVKAMLQLSKMRVKKMNKYYVETNQTY